MKKIILLTLVFTMIIACFVSCSFTQSEDADNKIESLYSSEITVGYGANSKPETSQCIALKCFSSFQEDKKVIVDVAMGDEYSYCQEHGGVPSYDTFGSNGYPVFEVYHPGDMGWDTVDENYPLLINGKNGPLEKKFNKEEMSDLDITGNGENISEYYHESIELDFSNFNVGDMGEVVFSFGWFFLHDNPYNQSEPDNSWCGQRRALYYYIGDNGIMLGFNSAESTKYEYNILFPASKDNMDEPICSAKPLYLLCVDNDEAQYSHGSIIERQFEINSAFDDTCYDIDITASEDITLLSEAHFQADLLDRSSFSVKFKLTDDCESGNLEISVTPISDSNSSLENKSACYQDIFYCHENDYDYIGLDSLNSLAVYSKRLESYFDMLNRQGELAEIVDTKIGEQMGIADAEIMAATSTYTVSGCIRWNDSKGNLHPAHGVYVEIYNRNGTSSSFLGRTTTDSSGYFIRSFPYDGTSKNIYICIYSEGYNIEVKDASGNTYKYTSETHYGVEGGKTAYISYTAGDTAFGKSLSVHQAMALANRYMYGIEGAYLSPVTVSFPDSSQGTSCYSPSEDKIYILIGDAFDWDVLEHEYGHYVQNCYNIANNPGNKHSYSANLADARSDKSQGVRLAWGEGWATYFAINLQNKMSASSLNIPNVGDTFYQDTDDRTIEYDIEFLPNEYRLGEANEATVSAVLYDITDGINTASDENDNVACLNINVWNITKSSHCTTLSEFITAFYNSGFTTQVKLNLGSTLSHYAVAAKLHTSDGLSTSTPSFGWSKQGGSKSYPNNRFRLAFYDSSYNLILRTNYLDSTSQTLTSSQWAQIKNSGLTAYCCVETYQTSTPQTGWYYSNLLTINYSSANTLDLHFDISTMKTS